MYRIQYRLSRRLLQQLLTNPSDDIFATLPKNVIDYIISARHVKRIIHDHRRVPTALYRILHNFQMLQRRLTNKNLMIFVQDNSDDTVYAPRFIHVDENSMIKAINVLTTNSAYLSIAKVC